MAIMESGDGIKKKLGTNDKKSPAIFGQYHGGFTAKTNVFRNFSL